jgi:uncharacterized membrane protein HdeD (DUF308 family)
MSGRSGKLYAQGTNNMEKTWMPRVGGILVIIGGAINIILGIVGFFFAIERGLIDPAYLNQDDGTIIFFTIFISFMVIAGIVAIIGGIFALRRKVWGLVLAGAIVSCINYSSILGIPALVFIILSRKQFLSNPVNDKPPIIAEENNKLETGKPVVGGIFSIVCGSLNILFGILILIASIVAGAMDQSYINPGRDIATTLITIVAFFLVILGILSIIGGIRALRRYSWGMALAGAILSIISVIWVLGVPSVILIALSRKEFH